MVQRNSNAKNGDDFIRMGVDMERRYGFSYQAQRKMVGLGNLPKPIDVSERIKGWRASTLDSFFAVKEAE
jgi:hypothetical protein